MTDHQASRDKHQGCADPPDQSVGGLLSQMTVRISGILVDASVLQGDLERLAVLLADRDAERKQLEMALTAIRDYEPDEVAKDEFAYDRMVESYRDAARNGLAAALARVKGGK